MSCGPDSAHAVQLARALVEYETLSLEEVKKVISGEGLNRAVSDFGQRLIGVQERQGKGEIVEGI